MITMINKQTKTNKRNYYIYIKNNRDVQDMGKKETRNREAREKTKYKIVAYKTIKT